MNRIEYETKIGQRPSPKTQCTPPPRSHSNRMTEMFQMGFGLQLWKGLTEESRAVVRSPLLQP